MPPSDPPGLPLEPDDRFLGPTLSRFAPPRRRLAARPAEPPDVAPRLLQTGPLLLLAGSVYREILACLTWPPETFGLLLGPRDQDHVVTHFVFDPNGQGTAGSFTIDHAGLNEVLGVYRAARLNCKGFAHAHPPGCDTLSYGDFTALRDLFAKERNRGLLQFFMPLVVSGRFVPYVVCREDLEDGTDSARFAQVVLF